MNQEVKEQLQYVHKRLQSEFDTFNLVTVAKWVAISPYHFHRLYREAFGETPLSTVTKARINKSCELLKQSKMSISEICIEVGFSSFSTFSTWFKIHVGMTPTEYRKEEQYSNKIGVKNQRTMPNVMNAKLTHTTIYVDDQESAKEFYTQKLGFEVSADVTIESGFRWLTVAPPDSSIELALMPISQNLGFTPELAGAVAKLQQAGMMWACTLEVDDCYLRYEQLKEKGVKFVREPVEEPYGIEAHFFDNSGNLFSLMSLPKS